MAFVLLFLFSNLITMKMKSFWICLFSLLPLFLLSLDLAAQKAEGCDAKLWNFVWGPERLQVIEKCREVTGTIVEKHADPDGDEHMLLKLDAGQENLLKKKNYTKKDGNLVIEAVCINKITRKAAKGVCKGYVNQVQIPNVGDHVKVTGSYVLDSHNGWTEIHPITKVEKF